MAMVLYRLRTENMALHTNDAREIQQPDSISLDSHKETTETQTVAAHVLGLACYSGHPWDVV